MQNKINQKPTKNTPPIDPDNSHSVASPRNRWVMTLPELIERAIRFKIVIEKRHCPRRFRDGEFYVKLGADSFVTKRS